MDKLEQERTAAVVFSYLIRGLSSGNRDVVKAELVRKMTPIKDLYGLPDEAFSLYIDQCVERRQFLNVPEAIEAFGKAIESGKASPKDERVMLGWIADVMRSNKTTGNVKAKRR